MKKPVNKKEEGFTIIEVMIVLAIAALIMVVVLVAIPQLQRNQRDSARQNIAGRIATEVNNFAGNNNGQIPRNGNHATHGFTGGFYNRYLDGVNIDDPSTGQPVMENVTIQNNSPGPDAGNLYYRTNRICDGEVATSNNANARNFALIIRLESGASYCLDNR